MVDNWWFNSNRFYTIKKLNATDRYDVKIDLTI